MKRSEWNKIKAKIQPIVEERDRLITSWNDEDALRYRLDELGKIQQTTQGSGTAFDPYKVWKTGMSVTSGDWWQTQDGYLWQAKKSGVPQSSTDDEYWDMVE